MSPRERSGALPGDDQGELPPTAVSPFCFPRSRRLRKRAGFVRVQARSERATTPHFVVLVAAQPEGHGPARLGITVSKQVGNAVARNRVKRLVREAFRLSPGIFPPGVDVVVIARSGAPELGLSDVLSEWGKIRGLLRKRAADALARVKTV